MKLQDDYFLESEGDAWFARNREAISRERFDWPLVLIERLAQATEIRSVLELGCADGWRLSALTKRLPLRACGVDASEVAIAAGRARDPDLELAQGVLSAPPFEQSFDLVIVNYVLHWIDRRRLLESVAAIDARVADGGYLLIGDFLPDYPQRRRYHHLSEAEVYTYKQDYPGLFLASGLYQEVVRQSYDHDDPACSGAYVVSGRRGVCSLLRKSLVDTYPEVGG